MTILSHLEELRFALLRCIAALVICAIPCGIFWQQIFEFLVVYPLGLSQPVPRIIYTAPVEMVMLCFKIAFAGGAVLASPFVFWQLWSFVAPGLYKKEKAVILPAVIASTFCFLMGISFAYLILPILLEFLTGFAGGGVEPFFRISEYFGFLIKICLAFGLVLELPVVVFVLTKMGVVDYKILMK
jgi:sec-independent protein translocase protein TatC